MGLPRLLCTTLEPLRLDFPIDGPDGTIADLMVGLDQRRMKRVRKQDTELKMLARVSGLPINLAVELDERDARRIYDAFEGQVQARLGT